MTSNPPLRGQFLMYKFTDLIIGNSMFVTYKGNSNLRTEGHKIQLWENADCNNVKYYCCTCQLKPSSLRIIWIYPFVKKFSLTLARKDALMIIFFMLFSLKEFISLAKPKECILRQNQSVHIYKGKHISLKITKICFLRILVIIYGGGGTMKN